MYFNSQPHEEADLIGQAVTRMLCYFNSQPHEEADLHHCPNGGSRNISTHSLTRRLTSFVYASSWLRLYFNSQPHEEADNVSSEIYPISFVFQLTASRGG